MFKTLKNLYLKTTKQLFDATDSHKRSPEWGKLEKQMIAAHPSCAACGAKEHLQTHHKKPFHLHPELELDESNLINLCMEKGRECHLFVGHGDSWRCYNPNVESDAAELFNNTQKREEIIGRAKQNRLFQ